METLRVQVFLSDLNVSYSSKRFLLSNKRISEFNEERFLYTLDVVEKQLNYVERPILVLPLNEKYKNSCFEVYHDVYFVSFPLWLLVVSPVSSVMVNDYFCRDCFKLSFEDISFASMAMLVAPMQDYDWFVQQRRDKGLLIYGFFPDLSEEENLISLEDQGRLFGEDRVTISKDS